MDSDNLCYQSNPKSDALDDIERENWQVSQDEYDQADKEIWEGDYPDLVNGKETE